MDPFSAILTLGSKIVSSLGAAGAGAGAGAGAAGAAAGVGAGAAKSAKLAQMLANIKTGTEIGKTAKQFLAEPPSAPIATGRGGVNYGNEVDRLRNKGLL
tara:strand:- start:406 stop:705 length:300 start_codon:yes stop_codon:yes gene_type:complete